MADRGRPRWQPRQGGLARRAIGQCMAGCLFLACCPAAAHLPCSHGTTAAAWVDRFGSVGLRCARGGQPLGVGSTSRVSTSSTKLGQLPLDPRDPPRRPPAAPARRRSAAAKRGRLPRRWSDRLTRAQKHPQHHLGSDGGRLQRPGAEAGGPPPNARPGTGNDSGWAKSSVNAPAGRAVRTFCTARA